MMIQVMLMEILIKQLTFSSHRYQGKVFIYKDILRIKKPKAAGNL